MRVYLTKIIIIFASSWQNRFILTPLPVNWVAMSEWNFSILSCLLLTVPPFLIFLCSQFSFSVLESASVFSISPFQVTIISNLHKPFLFKVGDQFIFLMGERMMNTIIRIHIDIHIYVPCMVLPSFPSNSPVRIHFARQLLMPYNRSIYGNRGVKVDRSLWLHDRDLF